MKITDFTIKLRNVAGDGEPEELDLSDIPDDTEL